MIARDVMTRNVISVAPDATVAEAVESMLERGISGLLVVDEFGTLAGIVTEGDLLRRDELGTERRRSWWLRLIASPGRQAGDFTRTHGRRVADVMTHDVLSVEADAPLADIVALMEEHRIKRVPVLEADRVVGVVSRADLLRALSVVARERGELVADDSTIRERILDTLAHEILGAEDDAEHHRGEWCGGSVGHHRQRPGTPRHLRDRRERAGGEEGDRPPGVRRGLYRHGDRGPAGGVTRAAYKAWRSA